MTPDRWARVKEIFNSALERDEKDRPAFLAQACGSDEDLRREVQSLLQEHSPTAVIESPVRPPDLSGRAITHYRILQKLGAGGMGVVYKAEDTKLGRTVALKFLPPRASVSEEHKARFVREAKAAAALMLEQGRAHCVTSSSPLRLLSARRSINACRLVWVISSLKLVR